jgi:hypothetical protein
MGAEMVSNFFETLAISLISGLLGGYASYRLQERKLKKKYQLQDSAERVAHELLSDTEWRLRSFKVIRHHLGGFEEDELRKILVRAGAIRFKSRSGYELWGLIDRSRDLLGVVQVDSDPANLDDEELFR